MALYYQSFARALRDLVPLWNIHTQHDETSSLTTTTELIDSRGNLIDWLYTKCLELQKQNEPEDALVLAVTLVSTMQTCAVENRKGKTLQHNPSESDADRIELQAALFDILGESEYATNLLFQLVPLYQQFVHYNIMPEDIYSYMSTRNNNYGSNSRSQQPSLFETDPQTQHTLDSLRFEALEKAQQAAIIKAQLEQIQDPTSASSSWIQGTRSGIIETNKTTHTLQKKTREKVLFKEYKKVSKEAAHALHVARQHGAILDNDPILRAISTAQGEASMQQIEDEDQKELWRNETKGLGHVFAQNKLSDLTSQLLPENSRVYYAPKSLPTGTTRDMNEGYEIVTIPPPSSSVYAATSIQYPRLVIADHMNSIECQAFEGTSTLNPMQSAVFSTAFHTRENMLICAPTGAGKTNVAMLAVVAHLRNVGILIVPPAITSTTKASSRAESQDIYSVYQHIGTSSSSSNTTNASSTTIVNTSSGPGRKIVYIAPMKALAQEVVAKFSSKLSKLKIVVQEFTGDMQLSKAEAERSDILVTTPEKWDVITRKGGSDGTLAQSCGLLLMDEIHILADEGRGAVIESIVARLHRLIESSQRHVRIVALSATLPNYKDVAEFLRVDPSKGLFYFGPEFRPVPLLQKFIGVNPISSAVPTTNTSAKQALIPTPSTLTESIDSDPSSNIKGLVKSFNRRDALETKMNEICYDHVIDSLKRGYQVMVFVHSRKGTGDTARYLADAARKNMELGRYFLPQGKDDSQDMNDRIISSSSKAIKSTYLRYHDRVQKSRNREVGQHFSNGVGIHHAGMLRIDRKLTEDMFADGAIRVLCCTATLAWVGHTFLISCAG